ncbi:MAG TPA: aspartyl protease family protein [Polyangia bacterium]|nr:aspartyl protease family protein [Polyangia bacterium]
MAYRGAEGSGPACSRHASSPAVTACLKCRAELCEICIVYSGTEPHCWRCAGRKRLLRQFAASLVMLAATALASWVALFFATRKKPFDYGTQKMVILDLRDRAHADRCDKQKTLDYADGMIAAGDYRGALDDADEFFAKCGDWFRLRWATYTAHERLHEYPQAIAECTRLIEHNRRDHDYWWWRAAAYEELKDWDRAASDYRQSLVLLPSSDGTPFSLSRLYERKGQPCRALGPLEQYVWEHADDAESTRGRVVMLAAQRGCRRDGTGSVLIASWQDPHALDGKVVAGKIRARFLVTPDSAYTTISRSLAAQLGVQPIAGESIDVDVGDVWKPASLGTLPSLTVGGARALDVEVAITELPDGVDGTIGLSFLDRFRPPADDPDDSDDIALIDWSAPQEE